MAEFYNLKNEDISIASYDISVIPNDFNVLTINSLIESNIVTMPFFQRNYVWDKKRASKFIESLILGLPIPQLFFYLIDRNKYSVIDGQQRLFSIYFFIKERFPKPGKRAVLRKIFDNERNFSEDILWDNQYFVDFKLSFLKQENGNRHPLDGKKYSTLDNDLKRSFELMPIRCMSIRQNKPEDNGAIFEIFSRLNTGGLNLSNQEIRGCLYGSQFYNMLYKINSEDKWRKFIGKKDEDDKFRDVEILLRAFALLLDVDQYSGSMVQFLNRFSKKAFTFDSEYINDLERKFHQFLDICSNISSNDFLTRTGSFNVALFESVFVAVLQQMHSNMDVDFQKIDRDNFLRLKEDQGFREAITHSTSHVDSVRARLMLARQFLFIENS